MSREEEERGLTHTNSLSSVCFAVSVIVAFFPHEPCQSAAATDSGNPTPCPPRMVPVGTLAPIVRRKVPTRRQLRQVQNAIATKRHHASCNLRAPLSGTESARNGSQSEERQGRDRQHVPDEQM